MSKDMMQGSEDGRYRLGRRIRNARLKAKLSQNLLSFRTGVPAYRISDIEHGADCYRPDLVKRLCDELGISMKDE